MSKVKRYTHHPRLTREQVLEARKRVLPGGDLHGRGLVSVGRAYQVGPGEIAKALGGLVAYEDYPQEGRITDYRFLTNANPNSMNNPLHRLLNEGGGISGVTNNITQQENEMNETQNMETEEMIERNRRRTEAARAARWTGEKKRGGSPIPVLDSEVLAIRNEYVAGASFDELKALHPALKQSLIERIVYGLGRWSHLPSLASKGGRYHGSPEALRAEIEAAKAAEATEAAERPQETAAPDLVPTTQEAPAPEPTRLPTFAQPSLVQPARAAQPTTFSPSLDPATILEYMFQAVGPDSLGWMPRPKDITITALADELERVAANINATVSTLRVWAATAHETVRVQQVEQEGSLPLEEGITNPA